MKGTRTIVKSVLRHVSKGIAEVVVPVCDLPLFISDPNASTHVQQRAYSPVKSHRLFVFLRVHHHNEENRVAAVVEAREWDKNHNL